MQLVGTVPFAGGTLTYWEPLGASRPFWQEHAFDSEVYCSLIEWRGRSGGPQGTPRDDAARIRAALVETQQRHPSKRLVAFVMLDETDPHRAAWVRAAYRRFRLAGLEYVGLDELGMALLFRLPEAV